MPANARTETNAKPALGFNTARFDEVWRVVYGPMTVKQIAENLGIDHRHFSAIRTGNRSLGHEFIAAVRAKLPNVPFEQLFPLTEASGGDES